VIEGGEIPLIAGTISPRWQISMVSLARKRNARSISQQPPVTSRCSPREYLLRYLYALGANPLIISPRKYSAIRANFAIR